MKRILTLLAGLIALATLSPAAAQGYIEGYLQDEKPIYTCGYRSYLDLKGTFDEFGDGFGDECLHLITSHGYLHREWLYAGGGTGMIWGIGRKGYNEIAVPVFGELRAMFGRNNLVRPYFGLRFGVAFEVLSELRYRNGKIENSGYLEPIIGVEVGRYHAAVSYMNQNLVAQTGNGVTISLGFRFGK